ncbi:hypothetical protein LTR85_005680 [Meristemomyces frigidus]|nr:hypothetical protein LTR85_005680 [Meristemomyces frigidus]
MSCHFGGMATVSDLKDAAQVFCSNNTMLHTNVIQTIQIHFTNGWQHANVSRLYTCAGNQTVTYADCVYAFGNITDNCVDDGDTTLATGGQNLVDGGCTTYELLAISNEDYAAEIGNFSSASVSAGSLSMATNVPTSSVLLAASVSAAGVSTSTTSVTSASSAAVSARQQLGSLRCGAGSPVPSADLQTAAENFCNHYSTTVISPGATQIDDVPLAHGGSATFARSYASSCTGDQTISYEECTILFGDIISLCTAGAAGDAVGGVNLFDTCTEYQILINPSKTNAMAARQASNQISCLAGDPVSSVALQTATDAFCTNMAGEVIAVNGRVSSQMAFRVSDVVGATANVTISNQCADAYSIDLSRCKATFDGIADDCDMGNTDTAGGLNTDGDGGCAKFSLSVIS